MKPRKDLTGMRFGRITVVGYSHTKNSQPYWFCNCDCGRTNYVIMGNALKQGRTKSCGCARKLNIHYNDRIYKIFRGMIQRCYNKNNPEYKFYGGRGISICEEWLADNGYFKFKEWAMENGYDDKLTIDRINVNGNYEPSNCRWATRTEQTRNRRDTKYVDYNGKRINLFELSDITGVPEKLLYVRIFQKHIPIEEATRKGKIVRPRSDVTKKFLEYLENGDKNEDFIVVTDNTKDASNAYETIRTYANRNKIPIKIFTKNHCVHICVLEEIDD